MFIPCGYGAIKVFKLDLFVLTKLSLKICGHLDSLVTIINLYSFDYQVCMYMIGKATLVSFLQSTYELQYRFIESWLQAKLGRLLVAHILMVLENDSRIGTLS